MESPAGRGTSSPAVRTRLASFAARARPGWPRGTPSVTEVRCFSMAFVRSQCAWTSSGVSAVASPKTCGWRWISFSTRPPATSSTSNGSSGSSCAMRAWKTTWSRTSPNSSRSSSRSPSSIASTSSYASSIAYLASPRCVLREVHGHSRRMRSMTWTRSSSRAPGRSYEPGSSSRSGMANRPEPPRRARPSVRRVSPSPPTRTTTVRPPAHSATSSSAAGAACSARTPASRR